MVDLREQAFPDLAARTVGLRLDAGSDLFHARQEALPVSARPNGLLVNPARPVAAGDFADRLSLVRAGPVVVEIRRRGRDGDVTAPLQERIVEVMGDGVRLRLAVVDALLDRVHQHRLASLLAAAVDQYGAALQDGAEILDGRLDDGVQQRMARSDEGGRREAAGPDAVEFEGDALVVVGDGRPPVQAAGRVADSFGDAGDLVPAPLAAADASAQTFEGGDEERGDIARLEPPLPRRLHPGADLVQVQGAEHLGVQGAFLDHLLQSVRDPLVDDVVELGLDIGPIPVANRFDEQIAQRALPEGAGIPEDVEEIAVVGGRHLGDLGQQPGEHVALASTLGHHIPQVAHLPLADAVDSAESLLDPIRIPRQVIVDHQMRALKV